MQTTPLILARIILAAVFPYQQASYRKMSSATQWSRPCKQQALPSPLYLLPGGNTIPYCHRCGRVISLRKIQSSQRSNSVIKYCSQGCRSRGLGQWDRVAENIFIALLEGKDVDPEVIRQWRETPMALTETKANPRAVKKSQITVMCFKVERIISSMRQLIGQTLGPTNSSSSKNIDDTDHGKDGNTPSCTSLNHEQARYLDGSHASSQSEADAAEWFSKQSAVENGAKSEQDDAKRRGQKKAEEREIVRCAARRLCVLGLPLQSETEADSLAVGREGRGRVKESKSTKNRTVNDHEVLQKCEAVLPNGKVVEPSFAKGDFGIRWRDIH